MIADMEDRRDASSNTVFVNMMIFFENPNNFWKDFNFVTRFCTYF